VKPTSETTTNPGPDGLSTWIGIRLTAIRRIYRLYREERLPLRRLRRQHSARRQAAAEKNLAARPNQRWALDFVSDTLGGGQTDRVLTIIDQYTRESLAIEVDTSLPALRVVRVATR